jgi:hypothetical protein
MRIMRRRRYYREEAGKLEDKRMLCLVLIPQRACPGSDTPLTSSTWSSLEPLSTASVSVALAADQAHLSLVDATAT